MSKFIKELLEQKYRLEVLKVEKDKWTEEKRSMKVEMERIQNGNDVLRETIASMDGPEREVNVEILAENANLISQLEEERENMRKKELEYEVTKKNYIHFKCRAEGLAKYINNQGKEGAVEIEKLDKELSKAMKMKPSTG